MNSIPARHGSNCVANCGWSARNLARSGGAANLRSAMYWSSTRTSSAAVSSGDPGCIASVAGGGAALRRSALESESESITAGSLGTSGSIVDRLQEYKRPSYFKGPLPPPMSRENGKYFWNSCDTNGNGMRFPTNGKRRKELTLAQFLDRFSEGTRRSLNCLSAPISFRSSFKTARRGGQSPFSPKTTQNGDSPRRF